MSDPEDENPFQVEIICAQPPYCELRGDKALRAQQGGCIWCTRVYTDLDEEGNVIREFIDQPGTA